MMSVFLPFSEIPLSATDESEVLGSDVEETKFSLKPDPLVSISSTTGAPVDPVPSPYPPMSEDVRDIDLSSSTGGDISLLGDDQAGPLSAFSNRLSGAGQSSPALRLGPSVVVKDPPLHRFSVPSRPAAQGDAFHRKQQSADTLGFTPINAGLTLQQRVSKPPLTHSEDPFASVTNQGSTGSLLDDLMNTSMFSSGSLAEKKLSVASSGLNTPDGGPGVAYFTPQPQRSSEISQHYHQHSLSGSGDHHISQHYHQHSLSESADHHNNTIL